MRLDYERKAVPYDRKWSRSCSNYLNLEYSPVMHSVAPLSEIESLIVKNNKQEAAHINKLRVLDVF